VRIQVHIEALPETSLVPHHRGSDKRRCVEATSPQNFRKRRLRVGQRRIGVIAHRVMRRE
jgi:hypothetical protein